MASRRNLSTAQLLAWEAESVRVGYSDDVLGRGDIGSQISRLIGQALADAKEAGICRNDVARKMAEYLGRPVPKASIDKWSSEATVDQRIPLDAFIALVAATNELRLLAFIPSRFGCAVVSDRYADLIELHEIEQHEEELNLRKSALNAKIRGKR